MVNCIYLLTYNLVHHRGISLGFYILGAILGNHHLQLLILVVLAYSSFDRVLGYGFKYFDSFKHTHLGMSSYASSLSCQITDI